jgi:hypothetical protein
MLAEHPGAHTDPERGSNHIFFIIVGSYAGIPNSTQKTHLQECPRSARFPSSMSVRPASPSALIASGNAACVSAAFESVIGLVVALGLISPGAVAC